MEEILAQIESVLVVNLRPHFLSVTYEPDRVPYIQIVIVKDYKWYETMNNRISEVFNLISEANPDIMDTYSIVVEPFDDEEFSEIIEHGFDN